jgi:hypothetical protein
MLQTVNGDAKLPSAMSAAGCSVPRSSGGCETRDAVVVGAIAAAQHTNASVAWVFCSGDRLRPRAQASHSDKTTCFRLLSAIEAFLSEQECVSLGLAQSRVDACVSRRVSLPQDSAFMFHDPPAAGDVIYN